MSCDKEEDPGFLRFRIGGLSNSQIKSSGPLQSLFEKAKVTDFLGSHTVWLRIGDLGERNGKGSISIRFPLLHNSFPDVNVPTLDSLAPSLIGMRQEPATEAVVPFFNQFEEWGYDMVGNSPQLTTAASPNGMDVDAMTCTWIFHKASKSELNNNGSLLSNPYGAPAAVKKGPKMMIPSPDY